MIDVSDVLLGLLVVPFLYWLKRGDQKFFRALELFLLSGTLAVLLKLIFRVPRDTGIDPFAFPSLHTALASSIFFAFPYPLTFLYALTMGILRILEGYHNPIDVLGGFVVAGLAWMFYEGLKNKLGGEAGRKIVHMGVSAIPGYFALFLDQVLVSGMLFVVALLVYLLRSTSLLSSVYFRYSRGSNDIAPVTLSFSMLFSSFFGIMPLAAFVIGLVDGLAAIIGRIYGKHPVPWNGEKTLEGFLGGVLGAVLVSLLLRGFYPVDLLVIVTMVAPFLETAKIVDDNLLLGVGLAIVCVIASGCPS